MLDTATPQPIWLSSRRALPWVQSHLKSLGAQHISPQTLWLHDYDEKQSDRMVPKSPFVMAEFQKAELGKIDIERDLRPSLQTMNIFVPAHFFQESDFEGDLAKHRGWCSPAGCWPKEAGESFTKNSLWLHEHAGELLVDMKTAELFYCLSDDIRSALLPIRNTEIVNQCVAAFPGGGDEELSDVAFGLFMLAQRAKIEGVKGEAQAPDGLMPAPSPFYGKHISALYPADPEIGVPGELVIRKYLQPASSLPGSSQLRIDLFWQVFLDGRLLGEGTPENGRRVNVPEGSSDGMIDGTVLAALIIDGASGIDSAFFKSYTYDDIAWLQSATAQDLDALREMLESGDHPGAEEYLEVPSA